MTKEMTMPKQTKKEFCCLILCGYGSGPQEGMILRNHMQESGMDTYLIEPCGQEEPKVSRRQWIHSARLEYLHLKKKYRRIAVIGVSVGGLLLVHLLDLHPAAVVFINVPLMRRHYRREAKRIYRRDIRPGMPGLLRKQWGNREFQRLIEETQEHGVGTIDCPALVIQTMDDAVSSPDNAEELFRRIHTPNKSIRYYPTGGHAVLSSGTVMAVCSDIFQFCSEVQGADSPRSSAPDPVSRSSAPNPASRSSAPNPASRGSTPDPVSRGSAPDPANL